MKKLTARLMILTAFVAFSFAPAAFADTILGTGGNGFQTWGTTDLSSQSGFPYWNHVSYDPCSPSGCIPSGNNKDNIGFVLTNTGDAVGTLSSPPLALPFWGGSFTTGTAAGGAADSNFSFVKNSVSSSAALKATITANNQSGKPTDSFGWYNAANPTILHQLFGPAATVTDPAVPFTPSASYGFYLETQDYFVDGGPLVDIVYETQASNNFVTGSLTSFDPSQQHFAAFQESSTLGAEVYWLGMEDLRFVRPGNAGPSDKDYQDLVVRIEAVGGFVPPTGEVPEPSSMMLLGSGLLVVSIGVALRRRVFKG